MPLFTYTISRGAETRTVRLRKSNPKGWLPEAISDAFPEVARRLGHGIWRLELEPIPGARQTWRGELEDEGAILSVFVTQTRK